METGRAAADGGGDKKKKTNMAMDWQNTEETRQTCGQDNSSMDPIREASEREIQTHLDAHKKLEERRLTYSKRQ